MTDIAPELLKVIEKSFEAKVKGLEKNIAKGVKNYEEAYYYAIKVGEALAKSFMANITSEALPDGMMYYNIANRVVFPMLRAGYEISSAAAVQAQKNANKAAGIGIKPQQAQFDEEKAKGIIDRVSSEPFEDVSWILDEPVKTFSKNVVDRTLEKNVEFQGKSGLSPKIRRTASMDACEWCQSLEGTYEYPDVPEDVYRRHANCNCVVEYIESGKVQNVHTKAVYNYEPVRDAVIREENALVRTNRGIQTGGHHYRVEPEATTNQRIAARAYEKYSRADDSARISQNTGIPVADIQTIRSHVFFEKHKLYNGYGRFEPDYDMAVAWKRLRDGNYLNRDITLLKHELLENKLEKEYNLSTDEAHARASEVYDWWSQVEMETGGKGESDGLL